MPAAPVANHDPHGDEFKEVPVAVKIAIARNNLAALQDLANNGMDVDGDFLVSGIAASTCIWAYVVGHLEMGNWLRSRAGNDFEGFGTAIHLACEMMITHPRPLAEGDDDPLDKLLTHPDVTREEFFAAMRLMRNSIREETEVSIEYGDDDEDLNETLEPWERALGRIIEHVGEDGATEGGTAHEAEAAE